MNQELIKQIKNNFYENGGTININRDLQYISISQVNGDEYFFKNEEYKNIIKDAIRNGINETDYIIYVSQSW